LTADLSIQHANNVPVRTWCEGNNILTSQEQLFLSLPEIADKMVDRSSISALKMAADIIVKYME